MAPDCPDCGAATRPTAIDGTWRIEGREYAFLGVGGGWCLTCRAFAIDEYLLFRLGLADAEPVMLIESDEVFVARALLGG